VVSWRWEVKARKGLDRLDYTQNAINKTWWHPTHRVRQPAPRSRSTHLEQLDGPDLRPDRWTVRAQKGRGSRTLSPPTWSCRLLEPASEDRTTMEFRAVAVSVPSKRSMRVR
jgi:bifunctional non-homologous end joining protein LigD